MQLNPQRLVLALGLCLVSMVFAAMAFALGVFGVAAGGLRTLIFGLSLLGLAAGTGLCACSVSGTPRVWAGMAVGLGALGLLNFAAPSYFFLGALGFLGSVGSVAGMVLSLSRTLGDATSVGMSSRALTTSIMAPLMCALVGILLEAGGVWPGAGFGLILVGICLAPMIFWLYLIYLTFLLIPRVQSLQDGQTLGGEGKPPGSAF